MDWKPHSEKQERAVFSEKKILALATGIQFGKTTVGAVRVKLAIHQFISPEDNFIIAAPTYKILKQSTLPAFLKIMDGLGDYNSGDAVFKIYNAGNVYCRTGTEPDSIVGITNVRHIWADEAGKLSLYFWENIQGRAAFKDCPITLTSSPYSLNWFYTDVVKEAKSGRRANEIELVEASSIENPYFPKSEWDRRKDSMDPRRFAMMFGGQFSRQEGLVYDCWQEDVNVVHPFELPMGTKYYAGVDWGYTDPFVMKVRAITPTGRHYGISEFYKTGMTITDQVLVAKQRKDMYGIECFYCDPSQPGAIQEFNRAGLSAIGARNDIRIGIDMHYRLIKEGLYKEFRGRCPYSADERESYHYPEPADLKPDQKSREQLPVGQGDHCMDVDRYITIMTHRSETKNVPKIPGQEERAYVPLAFRSMKSHARNVV